MDNWWIVGLIIAPALVAGALLGAAHLKWRLARQIGTAAEPQRREIHERLETLRRYQDRLMLREQDIEKRWKEYEKTLAETALLSRDQCREKLLERIRVECQDEIALLRRDLIERPELEIQDLARRHLITAMQRMSGNAMMEETSTLVNVPNEEMKGRLIGREGRNIKSFELVTGTSLLIDETPGTVLISAFDPIRREIARATLETLVSDGRIHPATIEEAHQKARREIDQAIMGRGEEALRRLRLSSVQPELVRLLGRLHYRQSVSQNTLEHSVEVAFLCALLSSELGLDPTVAKRCGLFHDIGKALEHEYEGSHAIAGANLLRHYGEAPEVVNAVEASHEEVAATSAYAGLLCLADSISASRPGARADSTEGYIQRVRSLEAVGRSFEGLRDCYALQAGREIRLIVDPGKVTDEEARSLATRVRMRVENELNYPGSIRVTVIRESRFSETAK